MCIRNKTFSLIYKLVILLVSAFALLFALGVFSGEFSPFMLRFFSVQATLFCFLFYVFSAAALGINMKKKGKQGTYTYACSLQGGVMMCLLFGAFVYIFMLSSSPEFANIYTSWPANVLIHFVLPLMLLADWAVFSRKGRLHLGDPFYWLALPFLYVVFVLLGTELKLTYTGGVNFPYPFANPDFIGWGQAVLNCFWLFVAFIVTGYIIAGTDKLLGHLAKSKPEAAAAAPDGAASPLPPMLETSLATAATVPTNAALAPGGAAAPYTQPGEPYAPPVPNFASPGPAASPEMQHTFHNNVYGQPLTDNNTTMAAGTVQPYAAPENAQSSFAQTNASQPAAPVGWSAHPPHYTPLPKTTYPMAQPVSPSAPQPAPNVTVAYDMPPVAPSVPEAVKTAEQVMAPDAATKAAEPALPLDAAFPKAPDGEGSTL